jgi:hypothetical protein
MCRDSWRFSLWNVQGIQSRPSHTLVSNFLNSLHVNAAVLTLTNLSSSPNPPWRHWPAAHWTTTITPSRGSGVAVVASSRSRPPGTVAMAGTPHPHFTPSHTSGSVCTLSALSTCEDSLWRIYSKVLPIYRDSEPRAHCSFCSIPKSPCTYSSTMLISTCTSLQPLSGSYGCCSPHPQTGNGTFECISRH